MTDECKRHAFAARCGELVIWAGNDETVCFRTTASVGAPVALSTDEARWVVSALVELIVDIEGRVHG